MVAPYISQQPIDDFGLGFNSIKYSANLAATTDTAVTIPGTAPRYKAVMKVESNGLVWVANNATAAAPAGAAFATTTSELITDAKSLCREVKAGDVLHFFATAANIEVSLVLYALSTPS